MQEDSMNISTSGCMTQSEVVTHESPHKPLRCNYCSLLFKSKVYLFEHLNKVHGLDVDTALREAGLKFSGTNKASTDNNSPGDDFQCQHCDFKAHSRGLVNEHVNRCHKNTGDQNMIGTLNISENPETKITVSSTNQHSEAAGAEEIPSVFSVMSTSISKCTLNSSKDLKTYKRPLQTITKYFEASSGSNGKPPVKLADSPKSPDDTKRTIILQESPSCSNPNSSGVFKVTAKSMIDITRVSHRYLLNDHLLNSDLRPPKPKEKSRETVPDNVGKRTNNESSKGPPAKKAKQDKEDEKLPEEATEQQTTNADFSFDVSEDEGEKKPCLVNGDTESSKTYSCKHCDYSDMDMACLSTHYQNNHPYIRYNAAYLQDPRDDSATFRCLQCPVEFISVAFLKRHYAENHPEALNIFTMQSRELSLAYKCFICRFTTSLSKALKEHYKDNHANYEVDNPLMFYRYSGASKERLSPSDLCEKAASPERQGGISPERDCTLCTEVKNAPSPQQPTSTGADVVLYHCNNCKFSHKSAVVMHVHYQKSHPGEDVTIDKIKQSARVSSHPTSQVTPPNSERILEKSAPQTSDSSKKRKDKAEPSSPKRAHKGSKTHSKSAKTKKVESAEDGSKRKKSPTKPIKDMSAEMDSLTSSSLSKYFHCQFCSYSSINIKSVLGHQNAKHAVSRQTCMEDILSHSAKMEKRKLQSEEVQHEEDDAADDEVRKFNPYARAENLFYCQKCNYGNPSLKGIVNHQNRIHKHHHYSRDRIMGHTTLVREEIERSKSQAKEFSFSTNLPLPLMNEGDEDMFFCHFCNYRHSTVEQVMRHYAKKHRGSVANNERLNLYTSMVREKMKNSHLKTANQKVDRASSLEGKGNKKKKTKLGKSLPAAAPSSTTDSETQRPLRCHRCSYRTQYLNIMRRHMWKAHRTNRSIRDILRTCFQQGDLQTGYHCYLCVFSHQEATAVYEHYQEHHPGNVPSLEYVTSRLFVSSETRAAKRKKSKKKHTDVNSDDDEDNDDDGSLLSGQNETKTYSCRACSFKGRSMSVIARHYRAVHPWSVKEDGSVLGVVNSKRSSANRQVQEDSSETPGSFESYQMPLEFDKSTDETGSSSELRCPYCPAMFYTQHGLNTHCGMKHYKAISENSDEQQQEQNLTRMHVFMCPHCTYVNTSYQGVLTHCQMKHPAQEARANSLHVDEAHMPYWGDCLKTKGPGNPGNLKLSGYMCETCPKICATLKKLNKHCKKEHTETVANTASSPESKPEQKPESKPPAVSKVKIFKTLSNWGSVSHASFLSKKVYAKVKCEHCSYTCSTNIALSRHMLVHRKKMPVPKVQDYEYKCVLCSKAYFTKRRLGCHYVKKHGRDSFLKYYAPVYKQVRMKPAPKSPERPLTLQPENTTEVCTSVTTATEEDKTILVYRCPSCPYVNASYHGTLTHCQMKHPDVIARADELKTDEILGSNMVGCSFGKASNERGYMCKMCPLIYPSLKKLRIHSESDHSLTGPTEHSAETKKQPDHGSEGSPLKALKSKKTPVVSATETSFSDQSSAPETCQSNSLSTQNKERLYKCHICNYTGFFRRYLQVHYKNTHKLDQLTTRKLLQKYNKRQKANTQAESEESGPVECKKCPELMFDSPKLLVDHYSTFHSSDGILDFTVISQGIRKGSTGLYRCIHCLKQMNGVRKLWYHLDCHRESARQRALAVKTTASPEAKSSKFCRKDDLPMLDTVDDLAQWNVTPAETFTFPSSPLSSPSKPADVEQPQLESGGEKHTCKQCRRSFMSLKGLRSHERSHAATAALKKMNNLSTSVLKHNINKYVVYKPGTLRPFLCSICSYRTTVMGLWRSHFMKSHQDVIVDPAETDDQDEESDQRASGEPFTLSEELNYWPELDEDPEISEKSYLEPPDVQRQLNHYSLMAQTDASSKTNVQETKLPNSHLLYCDFCNFNTEHLSSIRRHYLNRHGKKILRCKDCDFVTGLKKTLEMHMEKGHSTCQSKPTHQKDLRCPLCLYQTKNKNNMIDHIVLHREERVVPIEVRRSKLSRYLQGIVFRCHKCTFTSGSADNLHLHMKRHNDVKPYKCRLCYFDCPQLSDLEAHLSDKHQVVRNHELVGQVSLDELQTRVDGMPEEEKEEPSSNQEHHNDDSEGVETEEFVTDCDEVPHETGAKDEAENNTREEVTLQTKEVDQKQGQDGKNEEGPAESSQEQVELLPVQCRLGDGEDSSVAFTQHKEEAALRHSQLLDEDGSIHETHEEADQDRTVKTEVEDEMTLLDEKGSIPLAHNPNTEVHMEANNSRAQESFTAEQHLLTLSPKCAPLKMSCKESLGVSFTNCKQEQEHRLNISEEVREAYGEMPILENEYLKEETLPLGCCKEEDQSDQDKDEENRTNQKRDGMEEADHPRVPKGALTVMDGAAEVLHPATTQDKPFTCELCGRTLMSSSELERHKMRHRI